MNYTEIHKRILEIEGGIPEVNVAFGAKCKELAGKIGVEIPFISHSIISHWKHQARR